MSETIQLTCNVCGEREALENGVKYAGVLFCSEECADQFHAKVIEPYE